MSDVDGTVIDGDEAHYIPVELVTFTSQVGADGTRQISRRRIQTARIRQAEVEMAHLEDDFE